MLFRSTLIGYTISFTVTDGDGVVITNESVITENNLFGSITYKYKFNTPNAARRIYGNYTLTCIPPTITLGSNPSVCKGSTSADLTYSATANDPTEYTIDFDGSAEGAGFADVAWTTLPTTPIAITVPALAPAATYNAVLKVRSSATCESDGYPITVTVNPLPVALVLTSNSPVCSGVSTKISTVTGLAADVTYQLFKILGTDPDPETDQKVWERDNQSPVAEWSWTGFAETFGVGKYYVVGTDNTTGCKSQSNTVELVINPLPAALVLTGDEVCEGETTSITSSTSATGVTYQLFDGDDVEVGSTVAGTGSGLTWSPEIGRAHV